VFSNGHMVENDNMVFKTHEQVPIVCDFGYMPVSPIVTCQPDRTWNPTPICSIVTCSVPAVTGGYYKYNGQTASPGLLLPYMSTIQPNCNGSNFTPVPSTSQTCQNNGSWIEQASECIRITCNIIPQSFGNGIYDVRGNVPPFQYNQEIYPVCNEGFYLSEGDKRACMDIDTWVGIEPVCLPQKCATPSTFEHGAYNESEINYPQGTILKPTCDKGYSLSNPESQRVCLQNGTWSGRNPMCKTVQCNAPVYISNAIFSPNLETFDFNTQITITCNAAYEMVNGPTILTCGEDGTWGVSTFECLKIYCNDTSNVLKVEVDSFPNLGIGEQGNVSYNTEHYVLKIGSVTVTCLPNMQLVWNERPEFGEILQFYFVECFHFQFCS